MTNINWGQFLNNFANNFNKMTAGTVQNNLTYTANQTEAQQTTLAALLPNTTTQLSQITAELDALNQQQTINMLKELLNLPKNFESLLSQLAVNSGENSQTALMLLSAGLDSEKLSTFLQTNSKEAITNLYQLLAQYNQLGVSIKNDQLNLMSKLISYVSASSTSDTQSLKTIMLMYLPWLPLTDPEAFKLEIKNNTSQSGTSSDDSITLLISTQNYGNLQADIIKTGEDGISLKLVSSETFPQKEFVSLMKEEGIKYNMNINFILETNKSFNKTKNEISKTIVFMNTSPGVNLFLVLISNSVIKNSHIIDSKENLRELRKEKSNNGKS
ncbi:MAG: hypothetical protein LUG16_05840 [Candidatus Gastranaerophilales bacterium]|nr:hypothetical protein [Candidatus Gastranaerophilales bacterium]